MPPLLARGLRSSSPLTSLSIHIVTLNLPDLQLTERRGGAIRPKARAFSFRLRRSLVKQIDLGLLVLMLV